jgi:hypothetical protein
MKDDTAAGQPLLGLYQQHKEVVVVVPVPADEPVNLLVRSKWLSWFN